MSRISRTLLLKPGAVPSLFSGDENGGDRGESLPGSNQHSIPIYLPEIKNSTECTDVEMPSMFAVDGSGSNKDMEMDVAVDEVSSNSDHGNFLRTDIAN